MATTASASPPRYSLTTTLIGSGSQAAVKVAKDDQNGAPVAAKVFRGSNLGKEEASILRRCAGHENVIAFRGYKVWVDSDGSPCSAIFMELAPGGDLFDRLISGGAVPEDVARPFFAQLVSAVDFCHARGVAHRDIKLENVLLDGSGRIKLSDFGLAGVFRLKPDGPERLLVDRCGSRPYVAPELVVDRTSPYAGPPVDVWGAAVCLFSMLANFFPFEVACARQDPRFTKVTAAQAAGVSTCSTLFSLARRECHFSAEGVDLLDKLLVVDPAKRLSVAKIGDHPWVRGTTSNPPQAPRQLPTSEAHGCGAGAGVDLQLEDESAASVYRSLRPACAALPPVTRAKAFRTWSELQEQGIASGQDGVAAPWLKPTVHSLAAPARSSGSWLEAMPVDFGD